MAQVVSRWPTSPIHAGVQGFSSVATRRNHLSSIGGHDSRAILQHIHRTFVFSPTSARSRDRPKPRRQERCTVAKLHGPGTAVIFSRCTLVVSARERDPGAGTRRNETFQTQKSVFGTCAGEFADWVPNASSELWPRRRLLLVVSVWRQVCLSLFPVARIRDSASS